MKSTNRRDLRNKTNATDELSYQLADGVHISSNEDKRSNKEKGKNKSEKKGQQQINDLIGFRFERNLNDIHESPVVTRKPRKNRENSLNKDEFVLAK
jgi:hypothetical protein